MFNLQEDMYEQLEEKKRKVTVFLKNGVPVRGQIPAMDKFTVLMIAHGKQQLVYKQFPQFLSNSFSFFRGMRKKHKKNRRLRSIFFKKRDR
ncbi:RNA chaperone Hfq [Bacillus toyonensis]|nr:RNA chaperone Hfq [Bacillus toyonensis]PEN78872.1 RNA chaperone Hfq [Bacillus toyonensis]QWH48197.1 RNA chaperone Hfq [Bacillus toyonensis]